MVKNSLTNALPNVQARLDARPNEQAYLNKAREVPDYE